MTMQEYRRAAIRTRMDLPDEEWQEYLRAGALGEIGELMNLLKKYRWHGHEVEQERVVDELGDILWHVVQIRDDEENFYVCENEDPWECVTPSEWDRARLKEAIMLLELISHDIIAKAFGTYETAMCLVNLMEFCRTDFQEVAQYNVDKLKKRYPDGFSKQASREREEIR